MKDTLLVPTRYRGPAKSGNGGYVAGALARELGDTQGRAVTVTLRQPPPLEATMRVSATSEGVELTFGGAVVAQAVVTDRSPDPVEAVTWEVAVAARAAYPGLRSHPFPTCFSCGTERPDGLQIFPGEVPASDGRTRVAAAWTPDASIAAPDHRYEDGEPRAAMAVTWSALDCIGGWAGDLTERLMVLGRMTAIVDDLPVIGEQHVLVGEHRGTEGRKTFTASTLYDADGRIVGRAEHVWLAIDPATFNG